MPDDGQLQRLVRLLSTRGVNITAAWLRYGDSVAAAGPNGVHESTSQGYAPSAEASAVAELPRRLLALAKRFEAEALELGASADEMDWVRLNLYDPKTAKLFQMGQADRPATEAEQLEHFESFLKGLRANLEAQIALRTGKARSR
ncbi:MAG: hypothetical protein ACHQWU_05015 [Gemmatimonadales bacterium]